MELGGFERKRSMNTSFKRKENCCVPGSNKVEVSGSVKRRDSKGCVATRCQIF